MYFFIDESGDSSFYGSRKKLLVGTTGFQPMLNLGMITCEHKKDLRDKIAGFISTLKSDTLYNSIYSFAKEDWYL